MVPVLHRVIYGLYLDRMEKKMETTIVLWSISWGYIRIMEKKMEATSQGSGPTASLDKP